MSPEFRNKLDFHAHIDLNAPIGEIFNGMAVIKKAHDLGLTAISLMDKNVTSSCKFKEYIEYGKTLGIEVFPGVERYAELDDGTPISLIAIGFDPSNEAVDSWLGVDHPDTQIIPKIQTRKKELEDMGFVFPAENTRLELLLQGREGAIGKSFGDILATVSTNLPLFNNLLQQNPLIWEMICKNYPDQETEDRLARLMYFAMFAKGKPLCVARPPKSTFCIDKIHQAGGVILYSPEGEFNQEVWDTLKQQGIDGIMAWHAGRLGKSTITGTEKQDIPITILKKAIHDGLLLLGGSDYQRETDKNPNKNWQIGTGDGSMFISPKRLEELNQRLEDIRQKNATAVPIL